MNQYLLKLILSSLGVGIYTLGVVASILHKEQLSYGLMASGGFLTISGAMFNGSVIKRKP